MRWKWVIGSIVILIVALVVTIYAVLSSYDYTKLKPRLAQLVKDATGRELNLGGDVDLAIGFSPALVVTEVTLANASWGSRPQMIKVDKLEVQLRLLPLLFREVQLKRIGLAGVDVLLETDPNGQGNWDFSTRGRPVGKGGVATPTDIAIDNLRIENARLTFREGKTGSTRRFNQTRLDLVRKKTGDELALDLKADYNGQPVTLAGTTGSIHRLYQRKRFPVQLVANYAGVTVSINGAIDDIHDLAGVDLNLDGSGQDLSVIGPIIGQTLPKTDAFALKGRLKGAGKALSLESAQGNARRGSLRFTVNGAVQDFFSLGGMDLQSGLTGQDLTEFGDMIDIKLPETDAFEIQGRLTGSTDVLALQAAKASAGQGSMQLSLAGAVKDLLTLKGMDLQSQLAGKELADLGPHVGAALPELGPFDVSAQLTGSAEALAFNALTVDIDKSDFKGVAKLTWHQKPEITLQLESSLVDVTALMESVEQNEPKSANKEKQKQRLFSDAPLPFDVLQTVNADIVMKAENIQAKAARFKLGHLVLKLVDGDFRIDKFEGTYRDTKISGSGRITHGTPTRIATQFIVQKFDLGSLLKEIGVSDEVRSHIDIAAELNSRGDSVQSLAAHLDGTIGAVMGKGFLTKYLDMLSVNLSQKVTALWGWVQENRAQAEQINCAVVQFDIKEGVATSQAFVFDSQLAVLGGQGEINLGTEQIDFLLVPNAKDPSLLSLSTNLRVSGSIMDPGVSVDKRSLMTKGAWALSSLAVGPVGLLAPFVHLGAHDAHPCDVKGIGQSGGRLPATE